MNFTDHFGAQVGYRSFDVFYKVKRDTGTLKLKGLYFGGVGAVLDRGSSRCGGVGRGRIRGLTQFDTDEDAEEPRVAAVRIDFRRTEAG